MAKVLGGRQTALFEDVVLAQAFQQEALMNVLERQGMLAKTEVLEAIARLNVNTWVENPAKTPRSGPLQSRSGGCRDLTRG